MDFSDWRKTQAGGKFLGAPREEDRPKEDDVPEYGIVEQQLVRLDGTVLVSFLEAPGQRIYWAPEPGMEIIGPCVGRVRETPKGPWFVLAYFPRGYPGPTAPWPEDQEIGWEGQFMIETGVFTE